MAIYCDKECEEMGSLCDFCVYYLYDKHSDKNVFAGEGLCQKKNIRVDAIESCDDDFHCSLVKEKENEDVKTN